MHVVFRFGNRRGNWTVEQQNAYASYITLERIADHADLAAAVAWFVFGPHGDVAFPKFPAHLRARVPRGRFDGPTTPGAPHTYGELIHMLCDPDWKCRHMTPWILGREENLCGLGTVGAAATPLPNRSATPFCHAATAID